MILFLAGDFLLLTKLRQDGMGEMRVRTFGEELTSKCSFFRLVIQQ